MKTLLDETEARRRGVWLAQDKRALTMNSNEVIQTIQQARAQGRVADLSGIDLRVERFQNIDLSESDFSGADLGGTEFLACNLKRCDFHGANLRACKLIGSDLGEADLSEANLGGASLSDCKLAGCNLYKADLSGCILQSTDLTRANLIRATLNATSASEANLNGATMARASLRQADFNASDLGEADLNGADLSAAKLYQCKLIKCILHKADLRECDLHSSDFSGADLSKANLENARLSGVKFAAANLIGANLINTDITSADMSGADLRNADLTDAHFDYGGHPVLRGAAYDDGTEWPEALDWSQAVRTENLGLFQKSDPSMPQQSGCLGILSPILRIFSPEMSPRYTLPETNIKAQEREVGNRAYKLLSEVNEALAHNQRIAPEKKPVLKRQARRTLDNIVSLLWKLSRVRRAKSVVRSQSQAEIGELETRLLTEITHSSDVLEDVLTSTMQLEIKGSDKTVDRLLEDLDESNKRMRDLADVYDELRSKST